MGQLLLEGAWGAAQHLHHQVRGQLPQHLQPHSLLIRRYAPRKFCATSGRPISLRWHTVRQVETQPPSYLSQHCMTCLQSRRCGRQNLKGQLYVLHAQHVVRLASSPDMHSVRGQLLQHAIGVHGHRLAYCCCTRLEATARMSKATNDATVLRDPIHPVGLVEGRVHTWEMCCIVAGCWSELLGPAPPA